MVTRNDLIGTWQLYDFTITDENGETKSWDGCFFGLLTYTSQGYMSVSINGNTKYLSYAGHFKVENNLVIHHVVTASDPSRIGTNQIREASLDNNRLRLISRGEFGTATLQWQKITYQPALTESSGVVNNNVFTSRPGLKK